MIREITSNDIDITNELLKEFNVSIDNFKDNPYIHILMYDDKGIIVYSKIYDRIEIEYIIVNPKYQHRSIGSQLLNYIINNHKDIKNITLEVKETNNIAINFYHNNGFKKVAKRENYYGTQDGILMIREFDKHD